MSEFKLNQQAIIINGIFEGLVAEVVPSDPGRSSTYFLVIHIAGLGDIQVPNGQVELTACVLVTP